MEVLIYDRLYDDKFSKIVEKSGHLVTVAKESITFYQLLFLTAPDLVIIQSDEEEKNVDYLSTVVKNSPAYHQIPIILINNKTVRRKAIEGVTAVTSGISQLEFLTLLERLLKDKRERRAFLSVYAKVKVLGHLESFNEINFQINVPVLFKIKENVEIRGDFFNHTGSQLCRKRVIRNLGPSKDGHKNELTLVGSDEDICKKIRQLQKKKK